MNSVRAQAKNPITLGIVAFIVGTLFGLIVLGWYVWPVEWSDASPEQLSPEWQQEYTRMAIEAYGLTGDATEAQMRYNALGPAGSEALTAVTQNPEGLTPELIASFSTAVLAPPPGVTTPPEETAPSTSRRLLTILVPILCVLFLVLVAFLVYVFLLRNRGGTGAPTPAMQAAEAAKTAGFTDYSAEEAGTPVAQFMASYKLGDDLFDDSFSIDSASGEFLGECGVGISDTIGVGDPKKVTAFEVWLFDKNDIQTVTKVLMSRYAFENSDVRQRLEAKGEPVEAEPGSSATLDTQTLRLVARVVDMGYGEGEMPADSHFDHLLLEIAIWQK